MEELEFKRGFYAYSQDDLVRESGVFFIVDGEFEVTQAISADDVNSDDDEP